MKRFLMFSVSVLCLAFAALIGFYIGSHQVEAQVGQDTIGCTATHYANQYYIHTIMLNNGDTYRRLYNNNTKQWYSEPAVYIGNFWEGAVSTDKSSWGEIKGQFKK